MGNFSDWLLAQMQAKNITQAELGRQAGITQAAISRVLTGDRKPGPDLCVGLARALKISPITVFRAAGLLPSGPDDQATADDWMYLLAQLSPEDQEELRQIAEMKIERNRSEEARGRAAKFKPGTKPK